MIFKKGILLFIHSAFCLIINAQPVILPLKERAVLEDELLTERLDSLLPQLMRQQGIDMWIIVASEYNEDPVAKTMLPATWLHARRRTILILNNLGPKQGVERLAIARYDIGKLFRGNWEPEKEPNQWKRLAEVVKDKSPKKIGLNFSGSFAHADGLTKTTWDSLIRYLPSDIKKNITSAERLSVNWLQTRTERELQLYESICRIGHDVIEEGFSEKVVHPGVTTTEDVVWWFRERVTGLGLESWFHPTVDVQRANPGQGDSQRSFATQPGKEVIMPGDLLHVDFGIKYLKLNTDVQELAYVLKAGEQETPLFLKKALGIGNRLQDILTSTFALNKTGNHVLLESLKKAKTEGINASIYSHPIGYHGHAAGPPIGMWDMQSGVKPNGDYPILYNTAYAIELNAKVVLPEWNNKEIRVMLEEQAAFTKRGMYYIDGRQRELLQIPRKKNNS